MTRYGDWNARNRQLLEQTQAMGGNKYALPRKVITPGTFDVKINPQVIENCPAGASLSTVGNRCNEEVTPTGEFLKNMEPSTKTRFNLHCTNCKNSNARYVSSSNNGMVKCDRCSCTKCGRIREYHTERVGWEFAITDHAFSAPPGLENEPQGD